MSETAPEKSARAAVAQAPLSGGEAQAQRPLPDAADRELIRTALDRNMVVEAAAGTGKTTELVLRITAALAGGVARVDTLVAVTFTEKAAGELKLRLRSGLERARRKEADPERHRNLENALAHLEEARVGTIHAFCADLLRERPVEARLDPQFKTMTDEEGRRLYGDAFDRWFEEQLASPPEGVRRSLRRAAGSDETATDRLRKAGFEIVCWRDFPAPWRREGFDRAGAIEALCARIHEFADRTGEPDKNGDALFEATRPARELSARIRRAAAVARDDDEIEAELCALAASPTFLSPKKGSSRLYRPGVLRADLLREHESLAKELVAFARDADADLAALLQQELSGVTSRYEAMKQRAGRLDFDDLLVRARDVIRDQDDVRAAFQARFQRIFVDEFQDTDPLQAEILMLLAADDPAVRSWRDVVPAPGKLFIVGDPKQAIYRFRRADLGIYQEVKELLVARGATVVHLSASFRSVPAIQSLVNAAFAPIMTGDREALQASYVPLDPVRPDASTQPAVVALPVPDPFNWRGNPTKTKIDASLPVAIGAFIEWLLTKSGWTVTERAHPKHRIPIAGRHICLLFRRLQYFRTDVARPFVTALEARGVPHVLVGGKSFHDREEVGTMTAALSAIEWPDDELSVFATLRGSLFSISDQALVEYQHLHERFDPFHTPIGPAQEHLAPITVALDLLRRLHLERNYRPVADTVSLLLEATRAHAAFALRPSGEQALANVLHVADLGRSYDASGGISFRGFVERLRIEAQSGAPEAAILEEGSDGVRLMTAHKAKGLEFPVVILADITANLSHGHASRYVDPGGRLCAIRVGRWTPWDLLDHEASELRRDEAEAVRIAYVAATRARDLLVVPAIGDAPSFPESSWIGPVHRAIYPSRDRRRAAKQAPGCPRFGSDSVLKRPAGEVEGPQTVCPGRHRFPRSDAHEAYDVVWWDPATLDLNRPPLFGVRQQELLGKQAAPGIEALDLARHTAWAARRAEALARASKASLVLRTATEASHDPDAALAPAETIATAQAETITVPPAETIAAPPEMEVLLVDLPREAGRPGGPRYGTLVHAVLATVALDADRAVVVEVAELQGRILGAPAAEVAAAARSVSAALACSLFERARAAFRRGECRRETPITELGDDGTLIEGVVDLAFREDGVWFVIEFKTDREITRALAMYQHQVRVYASAIARATGEPARAILLRV